jgi:GNAT superfamily N-acetyltransferase
MSGKLYRIEGLRYKKMSMRIDYLSEHPEFIPTLAGWHQEEWARFSSHRTVEERIERYRGFGRRAVPTAFVAFEGSEPMGSANLVAHDMETRMQLTPWLASVYVAPGFRRRGIAAGLCERVVEEARALGFEKLYLFTPDQEAFYAKRGWKTLERAEYRHHTVVIMSIDLAEPR